MLFSYTVTNSAGAVFRGIVEASSKTAAIDNLERQGMVVVSVRQEQKGGIRTSPRNIQLFQRIKFYEYVAFVDHLATMLKVGYSLVEALMVLEKDMTNPLLKEILLQVRTNVEKGQTLSAALSKYPKYFSPIFFGLIKSGEASGTLDQVLGHLALQLKKDYELRKKVKSALVYPVFLFVLTIIVMLGMFIFILPRLIKVFVQSGAELPITTKILVGISQVLSANIPLTLIVAVVAAMGIGTLVKSNTGKRLLHEAGFRIPVVRNLIKQVILARISRTLSSLLKSGISILEAIDLTADVVAQTRYEKIIRGSKKAIERGTPLSSVLEKEPSLFPHLAVSMVSVGEKSGTLDDILAKLADFYEVEVDGSLKDLVTFLEPAMLFFIAIAIGFLALAIITPIYSLVGSIG